MYAPEKQLATFLRCTVTDELKGMRLRCGGSGLIIHGTTLLWPRSRRYLGGFPWSQPSQISWHACHVPRATRHVFPSSLLTLLWVGPSQELGPSRLFDPWHWPWLGWNRQLGRQEALAGPIMAFGARLPATCPLSSSTCRRLHP